MTLDNSFVLAFIGSVQGTSFASGPPESPAKRREKENEDGVKNEKAVSKVEGTPGCADPVRCCLAAIEDGRAGAGAALAHYTGALAEQANREEGPGSALATIQSRYPCRYRTACGPMWQPVR